MSEKNSNRIWELCVKKANESLSDEEERELAKLSDSENIAQVLSDVKLVHGKIKNSFLSQKINKQKNWSYIEKQITPYSRTKKFLITFSKYAAIFLVALFTGLALSRFDHKVLPHEAFNKVEVPLGQTSKILLADGTSVWLNSGSVFEYPTTFNTSERNVKLTGEAQFAVQHNSKIPFSVTTKSGIIKVHGTVFNVMAYDDDGEMVVTLIEGKVEVANPEGDYLATLKPSEQLTINRNNGKATLTTVNTNFYTNWINGKIFLNETKLSELVKILERSYNIEIKIIDKSVGDIQISGTIVKGKPIDLFLKILERMYGVKYELRIHNDKKDEVIIYKNNNL